MLLHSQNWTRERAERKNKNSSFRRSSNDAPTTNNGRRRPRLLLPSAAPVVASVQALSSLPTRQREALFPPGLPRTRRLPIRVLRGCLLRKMMMRSSRGFILRSVPCRRCQIKWKEYASSSAPFSLRCPSLASQGENVHTHAILCYQKPYRKALGKEAIFLSLANKGNRRPDAPLPSGLSRPFLCSPERCSCAPARSRRAELAPPPLRRRERRGRRPR